MIELLHVDCMEYMRDIPDNHFDLAIVDPPYGVNIGTSVGGGNALVRIGDKRLSTPKFTGGLMIGGPLNRNFLLNYPVYLKIKLSGEVTIL